MKIGDKVRTTEKLQDFLPEIGSEGIIIGGSRGYWSVQFVGKDIWMYADDSLGVLESAETEEVAKQTGPTLTEQIGIVTAESESDFTINVEIIEDVGYESAMAGLAMSFKISAEQAKMVANTLCFKEGGHNKFLESMFVYITVEAPRYWWQEADTYRLSTKQSESTMHTLVKEIAALKSEDTGFSYVKNNFEPDSISVEQWLELREACVAGDLIKAKKKLPEGFLQKRLWVLSYKELRHINFQRFKHRLPHWPSFFDQIKKQIKHPEFLTREVKCIGFTNMATLEDK